MKRFILTALMMMFATSALATESFVMEPLHYGRNSSYAPICPDYDGDVYPGEPEAPVPAEVYPGEPGEVYPGEPEAPVPAYGYDCRPGLMCPIGYDPQAKYCFRGGLHRCGWTCRESWGHNTP